MANRAVHSNAFAKALAEELARVPVPGLTDPATPTQEDLYALVKATSEPLTVTIGEIFAFVTVTVTR